MVVPRGRLRAFLSPYKKKLMLELLWQEKQLIILRCMGGGDTLRAGMFKKDVAVLKAKLAIVDAIMGKEGV